MDRPRGACEWRLKRGVVNNWPSWALSALAILVSVVVAYRSMRMQSRAEDRDIVKTQAAQNERISLLEMKMGIFWKLVEENLSSFLKKPTHRTMDQLLDKLRDHTLTLEQAYALRRQLEATYFGPEPASQADNRLVAILVMGAVEALIHELEYQAKQSEGNA